MRPRISLAHLLIRLGGFIQSIAIMVMRPDDLIEFSRQTYARPHNVAGWGSSNVVGRGLNPHELELLEQLPYRRGRLLLLGVGGGREAITLAQLGFQVTGVDFIPEILDQMKQNVAQHNIEVECVLQEISRLEVPEYTYDIVWISDLMYSCIPTRDRRIEMLKRVGKALTPGGNFICQFFWNFERRSYRKVDIIRKALAWLCLGNISYEAGDVLWHNNEFMHGFQSKKELETEFVEGGLELVHLIIPEHGISGGALLKRSVFKV